MVGLRNRTSHFGDYCYLQSVLLLKGMGPNSARDYYVSLLVKGLSISPEYYDLSEIQRANLGVKFREIANQQQ